MGELFSREDFEHGLRCAECMSEFAEAQPIAQRLDGVEETPEGLRWLAGEDDTALFWVTLICVPCSLKVVMA